MDKHCCLSDSQSSRALINVHVEDVNDNAPIFYPEQYNVSVREDIENGSLLLLLSANDADSGVYGKVCKYVSINIICGIG